MSDIDTDLVFKGHTPGGISCEVFIRGVRKYVVLEKKARDNEYIADYTMSCLVDDALHWSESLSEEVQGNWTLLRSALLAEYGSSHRRSASLIDSRPSLPAAMIPVPAAAPLPQAHLLIETSIAHISHQTIRGRVQVTGPDFTGFLSNQVDNGYGSYHKWTCLTTTKLSEACVLSGTIGDGGLQLKFENLDPLFSDLGIHLGMTWKTANTLPRDDDHAALTVIDMQGLTITSKKSSLWKGPVSWVTWVRSPDNSLTPKLEGMPDAGVVICDSRVMIVSRADAYVWIPTWKSARLVFEPI